LQEICQKCVDIWHRKKKTRKAQTTSLSKERGRRKKRGQASSIGGTVISNKPGKKRGHNCPNQDFRTPPGKEGTLRELTQV